VDFEPFKNGEFVESELGMIPKGWRVVSLDEMTSKFGTGLNPRKNFKLGEGNNYYVTIKNMGNNRVYLNDKCDKVTDDAIEKINKRSKLQEGDLLFSGIGTIGRVALVTQTPTNWNTSESVFNMHPTQNISSEFLYILLLSDVFQQYVKIHAQGGVQQGIRMASLKEYRMAIPEPTDEDYKLNVTMSFKFGDPFLKSEDNFGKNIASLTPMFAFPWLSRMDKQNVYGTAVGIYNFEREVHLYNDGSYEAYPTIKITFKGIVTNPEIRINDGFIRVLGTFNSDDELVIDCSVSPMMVKNNGENILGKCDRESEFDNMNLQIGDNTLSFIAYSGSDDMNVFVYYYKPYTMI
jgi:hypothetical protein